MTTDLLDLVRDLITSPWIYVILFTVTALDAVLPLVPSESVVILVGAYAAGGEPNLVVAIVAIALGALGGDYVSYWIGRTMGARLYHRMKPGTRRRAAMERVAAALERRGGVILIITRYLPALRNITTLTAGAVGYPQRPFLLYKSIAALTSAPIGILLGYLGGLAAGENPIAGVAIGLGLAVMISIVVEKLRSRTRALQLAPAGDPKAGQDQER
ncbi:DedA family protein [Nonomuraea purpurea]|uniref:DedA family protein n=1 Tax=Nonomuraea purpurea TaxID=1849276 RepID=A0ABV8GPE6_9ACTN